MRRVARACTRCRTCRPLATMSTLDRSRSSSSLKPALTADTYRAIVAQEHWHLLMVTPRAVHGSSQHLSRRGFVMTSLVFAGLGLLAGCEAPFELTGRRQRHYRIGYFTVTTEAPTPPNLAAV